MKKFFISFSLLLMALSASAVPAKKGIWKSLPLNGTLVKAQLMGDEHMHYWQTADGLQLTEVDDAFVLADMEQLRRHAMLRKQKAASHRQRRVKRNAIGDFTHYTGQKKGLIILVEFSNMQFQEENDSLRYTRICNEPGYNEGNFRGSVNDYFKSQSYGQFDLTFDVMGPVQMPNTFGYYGQDLPTGQAGDDSHPGEMVASACQAVVDQVDFSDYDWDGDGEVDQVMCIYAGQGQADGGSSNTIWPHEWQLEESDYGGKLELDGVTINTYAVANERSYYDIEGIGTICHEFSHCRGLPDMYDIDYGGNYGMGEWSLMDHGSYNGDGFCPSGYSSFDRYTCGWVMPVELNSNISIEAMQPLEDQPEVYMVRNEAYPDEYFLLENRQKKSWDAYCPGSGMLILYVDYDHTIWEYNLVNTNWNGSEGYPKNDHQRCTPFFASNASGGRYHAASGDPYPYEGNDSLTNTSAPAARLYHENLDGKKLMNKGIMDITRNADGTMAFRFRNSPAEVYVPSNAVLFETFNGCNGKGGNDGVWNTTIASSTFQPDNDDWQAVKGYGGFQCARFGTVIAPGRATTPVIDTETGAALLSFRAAGWDKDGTTLTLSVEGNGNVNPSTVTMEPFSWNTFTVRLTAKEPVRVVFSPEKRFLLDDVVALKTEADPDLQDAIAQPLTERNAQPGYYTLDGRYAGASLLQMPRGIYVERSLGSSRKVIK